MAKTGECIKKNMSALVVCAGDVSAKSQKEIAFLTHNKSISAVTLQDVTQQELSAAVGRNCGIISVNDKGFALAISKTLGGYANDQ